MKTITISWLRDRQACEGQIENFSRTFQVFDKDAPVELNGANLRRGVDAGLNLNWLARQLGIEHFGYQAMDQKAADRLLKILQGR